MLQHQGTKHTGSATSSNGDGGRLVRLASVVLQVLLELSGLSVANLYRSDSSIIRLLELDRTVTYIFT